MLNTIKSTFLDIGSTQLHLLVYPDNGPATLFLHANGMSAGTYIPFLNHLTSRLHLSAGDLSGHGLSDPPAVNPLPGLHTLVTDLQQLLTRHFEPPIHVVGHSMGGVAAYLTAARFPELIKRLVMIDPPVFFPRSKQWILSLIRSLGFGGQIPIIKAARRRKYFFDSRQDAAERFMAGKGMFKTWGKPFIQAYLDSALDFSQTPGRLRCHPDTEAQFFSAMLDLDNAWGHAQYIKCPVLLLRGQNSNAFTADAARQLSGKIPTCRLETIPGTTHFLPMEKPDLVASAILEHLI